MRASEFDYDLPKELIAQAPLERRDQSRLFVVHRATGQFEHVHFRDLPNYLRPGDLMVLNDSKVIPARLRGTASSREGAVPPAPGPYKPVERDSVEPKREFEILLVEELAPNDWWAMIRPGKRAPAGTGIVIDDRITATVVDINPEGHRRLRFSGVANILDALSEVGEMPLPPYIKRRADPNDVERYQTVFAKERGSVAAPTAGLHFTPETFASLKTGGIQTAYVTLHVGLGTFAPVHSENVEEHTMHEERFVIPQQTADSIAAAKHENRRVIAVGTTSVRVLETAARAVAPASREGAVPPAPFFPASLSGRTKIFIYPPFQFRVVDALLTNFHLPRSTLLMLVSAFGGCELILSAYAEAVRQRYRFFSYGDAMLIL
jgi:S-adenosylmethionine:tRNA ribosyltransferase-isomerase